MSYSKGSLLPSHHLLPSKAFNRKQSSRSSRFRSVSDRSHHPQRFWVLREQNWPRVPTSASSESGPRRANKQLFAVSISHHTDSLASLGKDKARVVGKAQRFTIKGRVTGQRRKWVQGPGPFPLAVHHGWAELTSDLCKTRGKDRQNHLLRGCY